jgi:hypothetical protein
MPLAPGEDCLKAPQKACSARQFLSKITLKLDWGEMERMNWYLKRNDGEVYGPVDLPTLQLWAMDGRVAPDDKISADLEKWAPVSDLAELSMKWNVELRDGSTYGPIHLLALRDLIYEGSVSRRAKIKHKQSGEEAVAGEALLFELIETESKAPSTIVALTDRLGDAEKRIEKLQQELQNAAWIEDKLRDEVKILTAKQKGIQPAADAPSAQVHQDLQEQVDKWRKLYEEAHATAAEAELKHQVREPKSGDDPHNTFAQEEVEKWKKLHEGAVAQIEQLKNRQAAVQPAGDDTVPRARIEEAERKLAQTERNYQQLLKTLNRSFGARTPGRPVPQADNLQRRDIN